MKCLNTVHPRIRNRYDIHRTVLAGNCQSDLLKQASLFIEIPRRHAIMQTINVFREQKPILPETAGKSDFAHQSSNSLLMIFFCTLSPTSKKQHIPQGRVESHRAVKLSRNHRVKIQRPRGFQLDEKGVQHEHIPRNIRQSSTSLKIEHHELRGISI